MIDLAPLADEERPARRAAAEQRMLARRLAAGVHPEVARRGLARTAARADTFVSDAWVVRRDGTEVGTAWTIASPGRSAAVLDLDVPVEVARETREALVAALHASGATDVVVDVLTGDDVAAAALDGLDVPLEATQMALTLGGPGVEPVAPPARVVLLPMTAAAYESYEVHLNAAYAQELFEAGAHPDLAAATEAADLSQLELLPDGVDTPGHHLWSALDGDTTVGILWVHTDGPGAFIYDIEVHEDQRRRGYGREVLDAGAVAARALGAEVLGLNVFGPNAGARALYERAGYATTERSYRIRL